MNNRIIQYVTLCVTILGVINSNSIYSMDNTNTGNIQDFYEVSTNKNKLNNITVNKDENINNNDNIILHTNTNSQNETEIITLNDNKKLITNENQQNDIEKQSVMNITKNIQNTLNNKTIVSKTNNRQKITKIEILHNNKNLIKNIYNTENLHQQNKFNKQSVINNNIADNNTMFNKSQSNDILEQQIITNNNPFNLSKEEYKIVCNIMDDLASKRVITKNVFNSKFALINNLRNNLYNLIKKWNIYDNGSDKQDVIIDYIRENFIKEYVNYCSDFINKLSEYKNILSNSVATKIENVTVEKINQLRNSNVNETQAIDNIITELNNIKNSINKELYLNTTQEQNGIIKEIDFAIASCKCTLIPITVYMTLRNEYIEKIKNNDITVDNNDCDTETYQKEYLEKLQKYKEQHNDIWEKIKNVDILEIVLNCVQTNLKHCINILKIIEKLNNEKHNNELNDLNYKMTNIAYTQAQLVQNYKDFYTKSTQTKEEILGSFLCAIVKLTMTKGIYTQEIKSLTEELKTMTIDEVVNAFDIGNRRVSEVLELFKEKQDEKLNSTQW